MFDNIKMLFLIFKNDYFKSLYLLELYTKIFTDGKKMFYICTKIIK